MSTEKPHVTHGRPGPALQAGDQNGRRAAAKRMVEAVAAKDYKGIYGALARDIRFRYLVPRGPGEIVGAADVAAKYFQWFGDAEMIRIESVLAEPLPDRTSLRYRFVLRRPDGWKEIEQQLYVDVDETGLISGIDLLCSGFRPIEDPDATAWA
jgi:hypothetical protein